MKHLLFEILVVSLLISGCGQKTPASPTLSVADMQSTAMSMAWTLAAQTMAAIPTATSTPIPPTDTPLPIPTATIRHIPTLPLVPPTNTPGGGCNQPLTHWLGLSTTLNIENETKGDVVLSIYYSETPKGECGYMGYNFGGGGTSVTVPLGCFFAYAWVSGKKNFTTQGGPFCINNPDKWLLIIRENGIVLKAP
jgi:hypothetical protein